MTLYKYRSIDEFKYFIEIILNNQLFAAPYFSLNDPMEGMYFYRPEVIPESFVRRIKEKKRKIGICSLSRTSKNALMWAHYANGHKGVVIGVEVDREKYDVREVKYVGPSYVREAHIDGDLETAKEILSHKYEAWEYEEEERIFVTGQSSYADVKVTEVIIGSRMDPNDKKLVKAVVSKLNPDIRISESEVENIR